MDIYWLKNGRKISSDIRYKILEEDDVHTLIIIETLPEDSGVYECVAINSAGEGRCEAQCQVEMAPMAKSGGSSPDVKGSVKGSASSTAPRFSLSMAEQNVPEGQAAVFRCRVAGHPSPTITWEKDGQQIKPSRYFIMSQEGSDTHVLRISEAFPEDEGTYKCVAVNSSGQAQCSASLHVLGTLINECLISLLWINFDLYVWWIAPDSGDVPPSLTSLEDVNVVEGSPAQFRTLVSGTPLPTIQWMREGQIIPPSSDFQVTHYLAIKNIDLELETMSEKSLIPVIVLRDVIVGMESADDPGRKPRPLADQDNVSGGLGRLHVSRYQPGQSSGIICVPDRAQ